MRPNSRQALDQWRRKNFKKYWILSQDPLWQYAWNQAFERSLIRRRELLAKWFPN